MPIFDYICLNCKNTFEKMVKNPDQDVLCPNCSAYVNKLVSRPAGHVVYGGELNRYTTGKPHKYNPLTRKE